MATFTNQATLNYNGISTQSNIAIGEIIEVLSANKTAVGGSYTPGETVTFVVNIVNTGAAAFTNLTVTDDMAGYTLGTETLYPYVYQLDSLLYYINGAQQPSPAITAGPPLVVTGVNVPAGGNATLVYEARVSEYASPTSGSITINTATITGGGISTPVTASASTPVSASANLSLSKSINPASVAENGSVTFTFLLQNTGNTAAQAADAVTITDTFSPPLSNVTVAFDGTAWTQGTQYTYNPATGEFATTAGQITVPAATYAQDASTGEWTVSPGSAILTVTGTL